MGATRHYPKWGSLFALTLVVTTAETAEAFTGDAIFVAISASVLIGGYAIYHRIHRLRKSRRKKVVIYVTNNCGEAVNLHCKSKNVYKIGNHRLNAGVKCAWKFQASRNIPLLCNLQFLDRSFFKSSKLREEYCLPRCECRLGRRWSGFTSKGHCYIYPPGRQPITNRVLKSYTLY